MRNFDMLDKKTMRLKNGVLSGVESVSCYPGGEVMGVTLSEKNMLVTQAGELIPAYTETHRRKTKYAAEFYQNGAPKAVALNEMQDIQTPIGEFPAELVTFYETGEVMRFFPLDGKIGGMWSEEEEKALGIPLSFELPFTKFTVIISGAAFYKNGAMRSITLFPGEVITVDTAYGGITARRGFSLYETGELSSTEPNEPFTLQTPVGVLAAYDPNAVCITADTCSLMFDEAGRVTSLITAHSRVAAQTADGRLLMFSPREAVNPLDGETTVTEGLKIDFDYAADTVTLTEADKKTTLSVTDSGFTTAVYSGLNNFCSPKDCAACALCV